MENNEKKLTASELFEIKQNIERAIEESEDCLPALEEALETVNIEIEDKVDAIAYVIRRLEARAEDMKKEASLLSEKATSTMHKSRSLKNYCLTLCDIIGKQKLVGRTREIIVKKNGGPPVPVLRDGVELEEVVQNLPREFIKPMPATDRFAEGVLKGEIPEKYAVMVPDMDKIRDALKGNNPAVSEFYDFADKGRHVIVR